MQTQLVQWTDDFSVGISEIDDQHRGLIALVNRVYSAVINKASSSEVEEIVLALEHYTLQHFADEERYMIHARYPKFGVHKAVHDQFVERVAAEKDRLIAGFPLDIDIVHFLRDWLINHILRMDKEFGMYEQGLHADVKQQRAGFFSRLFGAEEEAGNQAPARRGFGGWMKSLFSRGPEPDEAELVAASTIAPITTLPTESSSQDLNFQGAIEVHMRWKARFKAIVDGSSDEKIEVEVVRADDRCALGLWLYGEGKRKYDMRSEYLDVLMWHAEFHRQASGILETLQAGDRDRAMADLERGAYMLAAIKLRGCLARLFVATSSN